jgi:nitroreductase
VDLHEAIQRRAMVRRFSPQPLDPAVVDAIVEAALRAPTAGNTRGTSWVVLAGPDQTSAYWDATTDEAWRHAHPRWWEGLRRAPVILLAYSNADLYVARYREADKAGSRLGDGPEHWPVPYWIGDAAFGVMTVLLAAVDAGLGACVLGSFRGAEALAVALGVPAAEGWRLFCAVALGHPDGDDHRSPSLGRPGPSKRQRVHRGGW